MKQDTRVLVCVGNPPYDFEQPESDDPSEYPRDYKGGWVRYGDEGPDAAPPILEDFLAPVREAGDGGYLRFLYNDYVYFWRWALWKVFDSTGDGGIVSFITASSYLRGVAFAGMRRKMREVFDDLWIIDLEGDSIGARKTKNIFAIRTPVAIAIGTRSGKPDHNTPARVWKVRLTGTAREKLEALDAAESLQDLHWRRCSSEWTAPFFASQQGTYSEWPSVPDVFPWHFAGPMLHRTWPVAVAPDVLVARWQDLLGRGKSSQREAFGETRDRTTRGVYPRLTSEGKDPAIASLPPDAKPPEIISYAYRSFDREYTFRDARLGDRSRPVVHRVHSDRQTYISSLLTKVLGAGPAAVAAAEIPDYDHFCNRGSKGIVPLYRDAEATEPNVTKGLLTQIESTHGATVPAERLFAYAYGILAQPSYVDRFWDELELPPPRLPITKDSDLFARVADLGEHLLYLHSYGKRFPQGGSNASVSGGKARCTKAVSTEEYPTTYHHDEMSQVLYVGEGEHRGEFSPVSTAVWDYSVSGLRIVKSWLDRRKAEPSGRRTSSLNDILPERWVFSEELLELLWVLESTIELEPEGEALLDEVCASPLFTADELPTPTDAERKPPKVAPGEQIDLL